MAWVGVMFTSRVTLRGRAMRKADAFQSRGCRSKKSLFDKETTSVGHGPALLDRVRVIGNPGIRPTYRSNDLLALEAPHRCGFVILDVVDYCNSERSSEE